MGREPRSTRRKFGRLRQFRSGRWKASYTGPNGQLYEAPHTFGAREDAEAWLTDRRREIDRDLWSPPASEEQKIAKAKADVVFRDYAKTWMETRTVRGRPLKPRTVDDYNDILTRHLNPTFGSKTLRSITVGQVDKWYAKTLVDKPTARAHAYSLLRTIMETARTRDRIISENPCLITGAGATTRKIKPKPATLDQLAIIVDDMPDNLKLMVLLATWTALRFGELVELQRRDIDLDDAVVRVRRAAVRTDDGWKVGDPKSDAGVRDVDIPPNIIPAIERHLAEHVGPQQKALLFPPQNGGERLQPSTLYRHWYRARTKAKRPDLRFHDCRHTGATWAAQSGATVAELMDRLGHSTPQAAMRYQHAAQGRGKKIAEAMAAMANQ
ncbi:tyrosine-type recombinase/integrase [Mycolicibacterium rhodesiae]|uniref:Site-specific integrase n=1 Tax=Mycolicibacterium rhodesiae TaxID=36814 RepID=A0A1X0J5I1_MYCRH|nr:site-specific integrase [Mycolicibacterium rhodesiae]MCV7348280.1 site-specific integrase [Mycolicibacterium rhodesiae]ORB57383.1 site-specific integrase [Mycolicibacterium rhodesiae]